MVVLVAGNSESLMTLQENAPMFLTSWTELTFYTTKGGS
jgi:hypothetical protein